MPLATIITLPSGNKVVVPVQGDRVLESEIQVRDKDGKFIRYLPDLSDMIEGYCRVYHIDLE